MNIYDFTVPNAAGEDVPLSAYKGKVILVVNTVCITAETAATTSR